MRESTFYDFMPTSSSDKIAVNNATTLHFRCFHISFVVHLQQWLIKRLCMWENSSSFSTSRSINHETFMQFAGFRHKECSRNRIKPTNCISWCLDESCGDHCGCNKQECELQEALHEVTMDEDYFPIQY